jgi:hypothetical protein
MTAAEVTRALTCSPQAPFYYRRYLVVPNVYWGLGFTHELDVLALSEAGYAHEIEVKISRADTRRDLEKDHGHRDHRIRCLWFAGPEALGPTLIELTPAHAGVIVVVDPVDGRKHGRARILRKARADTGSRKFTDAERFQLARLGLMRYWSHYEEIAGPEAAAV